MNLRHSPLIWRLMRAGSRRMIATYRTDGKRAEFVLLLTTCGRRSGLPRITPLQYEEIDGSYYVASARGERADWLKNIHANPQVEVKAKGAHFYGTADPIHQTGEIADFLELRLKRHPRMMRLMLLLEGMPHPDRAHLERLAAKITLVRITPHTEAAELSARSDPNGA